MKNFFSRVLKFSGLLMIPLLTTMVLAQGFNPPSDVRNVKATAKDKAVLLEWDPATDADGVVVRYKIYYGVSPVTEDGGNYDQEIDTQSDKTQYEVLNLVNDDTYYFGVTAVDEQGNESELYSVEVSATPTSGSTNSDTSGSPILRNAVHIAPNKVLVVMSEPVRLANPKEQAYELVEEATGDPVSILNALVNSEQVTLIVDPSSLKVDETYLVTATTGVTDFDGNPVSSGIVDSVEFVALEVFQAPPKEETTDEEEETLLEDPPEDKPVEELPPEPTTPDDFGTFFLDNSDTSSDTANFLDALLAEDNPINNLDDLETDTTATSLETTSESQELAPSNDFSSAPDQIPPQDARNISADTSNFQSGSVAISWTPAVDLDNDIKDQVLYTRVGLGAWDSGLSLGKGVSQTTIDVQPNQNYQVRLVTVDNAGNESFGVAFEFSTTLSQSGGGQGPVIALTVIALLGFMILFVGGRRA